MRAYSRALCRGLCGLFASLSVACNLEEGLKKTPGVLSPDQIATIEGPGTRLLTGSFHSLMSRGDLLMVRRDDAAAGSLTVVDPQRDTWCELDAATRFVRSDTGWIAHTSAADGQSEVHFARGDCSQLPLVVAQATLPFDVTADKEAVLLTGDTLSAVDPENSRERVLASSYVGAQRLLSSDEQSYIWLVQSGSEIVAFDWSWHELSHIGTSVGNVATITSASLALIEDGPKLVLLASASGQSLATLKLAEDGCLPHAASREHFTFWSPCAEMRLHSYDTHGGDVDFGVLDVRPEQALPLSLGSVAKGDQSSELYFLRDVDAATETGSLWQLSSPAGTPRKIADAADLAWIQAAPDGEGVYALVDVNADVGRIVLLPRDGGEAQEIVSRVPRSARNLFYYSRQFWLLANPSDDQSFDLVRICELAGCSPESEAQGALFETVARGVPESGFASSLDATRVAVLHDVQQGLGTLSIDAGGALVAEKVPPGGFAGLYPIMKQGIAYLEHYDVARGTGSLWYWNQALDARGSIAENVSEFLRADWPYMGIVYLVPSGDNAGLWYARGK